jgi:hypothetical protein
VTSIPLANGFASAQGDAINNSGQVGSFNGSAEVVGYSDAGWWDWDAADGTQLLNAFVPAGWDITLVSGISNNGLILAQGSFDGGAAENVELAPESPELATGLLAGTGLALLAFARRRARFDLQVRAGH